jgi:hypothetical protein
MSLRYPARSSNLYTILSRSKCRFKLPGYSHSKLIRGVTPPPPLEGVNWGVGELGGR